MILLVFSYIFQATVVYYWYVLIVWDIVCFFTPRADGVMRTMNTEKLLKTLPIIQNQMDSLLDFNVILLLFVYLF